MLDVFRAFLFFCGGSPLSRRRLEVVVLVVDISTFCCCHFGVDEPLGVEDPVVGHIPTMLLLRLLEAGFSLGCGSPSLSFTTESASESCWRVSRTRSTLSCRIFFGLRLRLEFERLISSYMRAKERWVSVLPYCVRSSWILRAT